MTVIVHKVAIAGSLKVRPRQIDSPDFDQPRYPPAGV